MPTALPSILVEQDSLELRITVYNYLNHQRALLGTATSILTGALHAGQTEIELSR
jgi:hypothetical protein